jgi:hypothetical protein
VQLAREAGALPLLAMALRQAAGMDDILPGRFADAEARFAESSDVANAAGHPPGATQSTAGALMVAAWRGREEEARRLADTCRHAGIAAGRGR